jgi:spore maturation protein CgeB
MLMVCDKAGADAHAQIFEPDKEAVYYDTLDDAIGLIEHYLKDESRRIEIARNGFERFWRDYHWEKNLRRFLDWSMAIRRDS